MKTKRSPRGDLFILMNSGLRLLRVFLLEFLDTAGRVNKHLLARKEGVGSGANLDLDNRVIFAIRPFDGLLGFKGGAAHELEIA